MTYIVQRKDRFYVVAYDGLDPLTGKERRRWHPVGNNRIEAEAVAAQLDATHAGSPPPRGGPIEFGAFLTETWLPQKRRRVRATTAYRYAWFIQHSVNPAIGHVPLRRLRADHLDTLYECLATTGGKDSTGLAHKTVHEVHMIISAALELAVLRGLLDRNVAHATIARRRRVTKSAARIWTPHEVGHFLHVATTQRLYPALHLTAPTGLRRGEIVGLKWGDLDNERKRLSISRTLQTVGGVPTEVGVKTRTSRRCVDLDTETLNILIQILRGSRRCSSESEGDAVLADFDAGARQFSALNRVFVEDRVGVVDVDQHLARLARQLRQPFDHAAGARLRQVANFTRTLAADAQQRRGHQERARDHDGGPDDDAAAPAPVAHEQHGDQREYHDDTAEHRDSPQQPRIPDPVGRAHERSQQPSTRAGRK